MTRGWVVGVGRAGPLVATVASGDVAQSAVSSKVRSWEAALACSGELYAVGMWASVTCHGPTGRPSSLEAGAAESISRPGSNVVPARPWLTTPTPSAMVAGGH